MFAGNIYKVRREVDWYFNCSDSAMGLGSNWYTVLNGDMGSRSSTNPETIIFHLKDIRKHRRIWQALDQLPRTEFRYLMALYCDEYKDKYSIIIRDIFKEKTGLALCLFSDLDLLMKIARNHPHKLSPLQNEILTKL